MSCKTVSQHVRRQSHAQAGSAAIGGENLPDAHAAQGATAAIDEQSVCGDLFALAHKLGSGFFQIALDKSEGFLADRNDALFIALANATNAARRAIQIHNPQMN